MKTTLLIFLAFLLPTGLLAQKLTPEAIETDLLNSFKMITYWADKNNSDYNPKNDDKLEQANDAFYRKLSDYAKKYPTTISQSFSSLIHAHLNITTSEDGSFRIYSWDRQTGGTMHFFENIFQYKVLDKTNLFEPKHIEADAGCYYTNIYAVKTSKNVYYLATFYIIGSTKDLGGGIQAFAIENGVLNNDVKIIKTQTGLHSSINYEYDASYINDRNKYPDIEYNKVLQTIKIPLIETNGKATHKFITYKFTGKYFEKVK
jgi:hypothetical protein